MSVDLLAEKYLRDVVAKYEPTAAEKGSVLRAYGRLGPTLRSWAGEYLRALQLAGSYTKGTAIRGDTDLDIFVSLRRHTPGSLKDVFDNLSHTLHGYGLGVEQRNVSVRTWLGGLAVDVVPGRQQGGVGEYHSLYSRRRDAWIQTNIRTHITLVKGSAFRREIRLLKIWRQNRELDFPSFYLELCVLDALRGTKTLALSRTIWALLSYLTDEFAERRLVDPANSGNVVSDELSDKEKAHIVGAAAATLSASTWSDVVR